MSAYNRKGFSLPVVLGILLVLSTLLGVLGMMDSMDMGITIKAHQERQFRLLERTAEDVFESNLKSDKWVMNGAIHRSACLDSNRYCFQTDVIGMGTWAYAQNKVWDLQHGRDTIQQKTQLRISALAPETQGAESENLIFWDSILNLAVANQTVIKGKVRLNPGTLSPALRSEIAWTGNMDQAKVIHRDLTDKETFPDLKMLKPWLNDIEKGKWNPDSILICQKKSKGILKIAQGSYENCLIVAPEIVIEGNADLNWSLLLADKIKVSDHVVLTHTQFYARESLMVQLSQEQKEINWFFLVPKEDSLPIPNATINTKKAWVFVYAMQNFQYGIPILKVDSGSTLLGELWSNGYADIRAKMSGNLRIASSAGQDQGVLWLNTMLGGTFEPLPQNPKWTLPIFWPGQHSMKRAEIGTIRK